MLQFLESDFFLTPQPLTGSLYTVSLQVDSLNVGLFFPFVSGPRRRVTRNSASCAGRQASGRERQRKEAGTRHREAASDLGELGFRSRWQGTGRSSAQPVTRERLPVSAELLLSVPLCFVHCTRRYVADQSTLGGEEFVFISFSEGTVFVLPPVCSGDWVF